MKVFTSILVTAATPFLGLILASVQGRFVEKSPVFTAASSDAREGRFNGNFEAYFVVEGDLPSKKPGDPIRTFVQTMKMTGKSASIHWNTRSGEVDGAVTLTIERTETVEQDGKKETQTLTASAGHLGFNFKKGTITLTKGARVRTAPVTSTSESGVVDMESRDPVTFQLDEYRKVTSITFR